MTTTAAPLVNKADAESPASQTFVQAIIAVTAAARRGGEVLEDVARDTCDQLLAAYPELRRTFREFCGPVLLADGHPDPAAVLDRLIPTPALPYVKCMADVEPEDVQFVWEPYIARRKLTLFEGDPGEGKTWLVLWIAARISRGEPLPGNTATRRPGCVLYWTGEDGLGDTLRPRLERAGADLSRVHVIAPYTEIGEALTLGGSKQQIEAALEQVRPDLLVIDPIQAALGADVDAHRANEVRPLMQRLMQWAEAYNCAVVVIRHLSKAPTGKAIHRGLGSIDFAAAARSIVLVGRDPQNPDLRVLVHTKSSLAPEGPALEFEIAEGGYLRWTEGPSTMTAAKLLGAPAEPEDHSAQDEAAEFLRGLLADGHEVEAETVQKKARKAGIAERTLRRAKEGLGVRYRKQKKDEGGAWVWWLPNGPTAATVPTGQDGQGGKSKVPRGQNQLVQVGHSGRLAEPATLVEPHLFTELAEASEDGADSPDEEEDPA